MSIQYKQDENKSLLTPPTYEEPEYNPAAASVPNPNDTSNPNYVPYVGTYVDVGQNFTQPPNQPGIPVTQPANPPSYVVTNSASLPTSAPTNYVSCCSVFLIVIAFANILIGFIMGTSDVSTYLSSAMMIICGGFGLYGFLKKKPMFIRVYWILLVVSILINVIAGIVVLSGNYIYDSIIQACQDPNLKCTDESIKNALNFTRTIVVVSSFIIPILGYGSCAYAGARYERYVRVMNTHSLEDQA